MSVSVLALLLVILMSIVDSATGMWRQSENRVDSYREARAALNVIASDVAASCASRSTNFFERPDDHSLRFLTSVTPAYQKEGNKSNVCEVAYTWRYDRANPLQVNSSEGYNLYRKFLSSDDTWNKIRNNSDQEGSEELLARNIVEFEVKPFSIDDDGDISDWDPEKPETPMPDMIEIRLTALNNQVAGRFESQSEWDDANSPTRERNDRTFVTRVRVNAKSVKSQPGT